MYSECHPFNLLRRVFPCCSNISINKLKNFINKNSKILILRTEDPFSENRDLFIFSVVYRKDCTIQLSASLGQYFQSASKQLKFENSFPNKMSGNFFY